MGKHTKEPWAAQNVDAYGSLSVCRAKDPLYRWIAHPLGDKDGRGCFTHEERNANAARIVSCVNALAGIENPEAFVALVRKVATFNHEGHSPENDDLCDLYDMLTPKEPTQ